MSRVSVLLAAILALPSVLPGQDAAAWRDSTYRLTELMHRVRDSIRRADAGTEEIARRSGLIVSASSKHRMIAKDVLERFDSLRQHWFGSTTPSPHGFRITLRSGEIWSFGRLTGNPQSLSIAGLPHTDAAPHAAPFVVDKVLGNAEKAAQVFLAEYSNLMMGATADAVRSWLRSGLLLSLSDESRKEQAMYALVTGDGKAQRDCVRGDPGACAYAMGLRLTTDPEAGGQYYPLARADLLLTGLELGGAGAWQRLGASEDDSIEERLASAAGMPMDSLLLGWRAGLLALQPERGPLDLTTAGLILGWSLLVVVAGLWIARWV